MSVFTRIRRGFMGQPVDPATQREADAAKERADLSRLSQEMPSSVNAAPGIVTPDRLPKPE
jgi:hypothetical protein